MIIPDIIVVILNLIRLSHAKVRRIFGIVKFIWHFNKNSSTAVPLRNERYKEFEIYANAGTKFIKILKIIFLDYYPSRNFSWKHSHIPKKIDSRKSKRYKRYKHYTFESKESSTMLFSAITTYFWPPYYQLFGILYAIFPCV